MGDIFGKVADSKLKNAKLNGLGTLNVANFPLWEPPTQPNTWASNSMSYSTFLSTFYDPYVGTDAVGHVVSKTSLGKDESGTYDIYKYMFTPANYERTIILTAGMHGTEITPPFALARMLGYVMAGGLDSLALQYIKEKVRLIVIPILNPWGFSQSPRVYANVNGVNPIRNFDSNGAWVAYPITLNLYDYKGTSAFSEAEAVILRDLYLEYADDCDLIYDCHTGDVGNYDQYVIVNSTDNVLRPKILEAVSELDAELIARGVHSGTDWISTDPQNSIRSAYCIEQLNIPTLSIEMITGHFGGAQCGSLDLEYYIMFLVHYLAKGLSQITDTDSFAVRNNDANNYDVDALKTSYRLDTVDSAKEILLIDRFNRDNSTNLRYSETKQRWLSMDGSFSISSNKAIGTTATNNNRNAIYVGESDFDASVDVTWQTYAGLSVRIKDIGNFYSIRINSTSLAIIRYIDEVATVLQSYAFTPVAGTTYNIRAVASGTKIDVYLDGTLRLSVTDATYQTEKMIGLRTFNDITSTFDNLIVRKVTTNQWKDWIPTVTWGTADPTGSVAQVARYRVIGDICFFNYSFSATDGNAASSLTISVPVTPKDNNSILPIITQQKVNTTWSGGLGYIDDDSGGIAFRTFATCTDGQAVEVAVSGFYEV